MRRAVLVVCDGLRADMITAETTPNLMRLAGASTVFANHRGVFPSTTRVTAASIATGCLPGRHGLEGNVVALDEGEGLVALSVGPPEFRDRLFAARGATLKVPTLAQRVQDHGGSMVFANASAGAAQFQDPDGYGYVYHRQISYGPGRRPLPDGETLRVSHDKAGDCAMTDRFLEAILSERRPALAVLWLCEPDHSQHGHPLGSPQHLEAIAAADSCVARVAEALDSIEDDALLALCSDHGHETVAEIIPLEAMLIAQGLKDAPGSHDLVVASNGTSASIYLSQPTESRCTEVVKFLQAQDWVGELYAEDALGDVGLRPENGLAIALTPKTSSRSNGYGIPGMSYAIADPLSNDTRIGCGQHGGLGRHEQQPFLFLHSGGFPAGTKMTAPSAPIDIAPTVLRHLGLSSDGMDGTPLPRH